MATLCRHICVSPNTAEVWAETGLLPKPRMRGGVPMWRWAEVKEALRGNIYFVRSADFIKIGYSYSQSPC
jgi:predicted site-specific integrase-resolvase